MKRMIISVAIADIAVIIIFVLLYITNRNLLYTVTKNAVVCVTEPCPMYIKVETPTLLRHTLKNTFILFTATDIALCIVYIYQKLKKEKKEDGVYGKRRS